MQEEFARAAIIMEQGEQNWPILYKQSDFFLRHANFLQITIRATNGRDFSQWQRYCESRLRLLISAIDTDQVNAWPLAKFFDKYYNAAGRACEQKDSTPDSLREAFFFIALRFAPGVESINLRYCTNDFLQTVNNWDKRTANMDMGIALVTQNDIPDFVLEAMGGNDDDEPELQSTASSTADSKEQTAATDDNADVRPHTPVQGESQTGLTPKIARSTLSEEDVITSPTKKARN
jgi:poly(A) polymerase Pap1